MCSHTVLTWALLEMTREGLIGILGGLCPCPQLARPTQWPVHTHDTSIVLKEPPDENIH